MFENKMVEKVSIILVHLLKPFSVSCLSIYVVNIFPEYRILEVLAAMQNMHLCEETYFDLKQMGFNYTILVSESFNSLVLVCKLPAIGINGSLVHPTGFDFTMLVHFLIMHQGNLVVLCHLYSGNAIWRFWYHWMYLNTRNLKV